MKHFLKNVNKKLRCSKLSEDQTKTCEEDLTEKDLYNSLRSMQNDNSPGNDALHENKNFRYTKI